MYRYNCNNCTERDRKKCFPERNTECTLMLPLGFQMVDDEHKMKGFHAMMSKLNLRVELRAHGDFQIVGGDHAGS
jgi:hypothetical protein